MGFLDIFLGSILAYTLYKGLKNGLFVELASLLALILGIFIAIKCSYLVRSSIAEQVSWSPKYIEITAFGLTFLGVVIGIHFLAKIFTGVANFAYLGWLNKLGGAAFSLLKMILALSIVFTLFQKININNILASKDTLDKSIFFKPILEVAGFVFPSLEKMYREEFSNEITPKV